MDQNSSRNHSLSLKLLHVVENVAHLKSAGEERLFIKDHFFYLMPSVIEIFVYFQKAGKGVFFRELLLNNWRFKSILQYFNSFPKKIEFNFHFVHCALDVFKFFL